MCVRHVVQEEFSFQSREKHPSGQFLTPEQIADMALFLARDEARNITGASFSLDGGWTAV